MKAASWKEGLVPVPDRSELLAILSYDRESGSLTWKRNGKPAGCRQYRANREPNAIRIGIQRTGRLYQFVAHRLIFQMMGEIVPEGLVIDHRDGNPFNNKWENLRLSTHHKNICNQKRIAPRKNNIPANVYPNGRGFFAMVKLDGRVHRTPTTMCLQQAIKDRNSLLILHGEYAKPV